VLLSVLTAWYLTGCHASARPDPATLYQSAYDDFLRGNLNAVQTKAAQARGDLPSEASRTGPNWELKFRLLQAEALLYQGEQQAVIALLNDCTPFPSGGDPAIKQRLLCSRAHLHLGSREQSEQELRDARQLADSTHSRLVGEVLRAEALLERDSGHWDRAFEKLSGSLALARTWRDRWLEVSDLVDLGHVSLEIEHFDQALALSQEAANAAASIHAQWQIRLAVGNIGWAYFNLGDFENALANFQTAEKLSREAGATWLQVQWLRDAGLAEYKLGNLEDARKYDEQALQSALTAPAAADIDQIANIEANLALLLLDQGQYDAAKVYSDRSVLDAQHSKDPDVIAYAMLLEGMTARRQVRYQDAQRALLSALQVNTSSAQIRVDLQDEIANLYSDQHRLRQAELWYDRSIQTFEGNRASIHDEALRLSSFASHGDAAYRDYAGFLMGSNRSVEALQLLDHSRARTLEEGLGVGGTAVQARRQGLGEPAAIAQRFAATILFYSLGPEKSYLWAITAKETRVFTLPKEQEIRSLIDEYQRAIQKSIDPLQATPQAAVTLYDILIKPAATLIPAGSKVILIPDGTLHRLNFETLLEPTSEGFRYWIEDATITTASSIRILSRSDASSSETGTRNLLLIGNPTSAGNGFDALQNAPAEIERIQSHFPRDAQRVLTQAQAVPTAYASSSPDRFRYIHFVAHGTASRSSPLDSAIVLSPLQNNPGDFKLYARDIVQHPLHARLVTISACYGSGLRTYVGEGLVGLAWAFLRAGSHNVIGALWQADDAATPLLMDRLYAELEAGKTPDEALRTAKLALIHSTNVYRKPFYWAVFQLYAGA
jgi:CHAT domain-containing protein